MGLTDQNQSPPPSKLRGGAPADGTDERTDGLTDGTRRDGRNRQDWRDGTSWTEGTGHAGEDWDGTNGRNGTGRDGTAGRTIWDGTG